MAWVVVGATALGVGATLWAGENAEDAAHAEGQRIDELEREKFAEAKVQADLLREKGDEAAAVALEEAGVAELGAARFEALSNEYAQSAEDFAQTRQTKGQDYAQLAQDFALRNEELGIDLYNKIGLATEERQAIGEKFGFSAAEFAERNEIFARKHFDTIQEAERARAATGEAGAQRITDVTAEGVGALRDAAGNVMTQAERAGELQTDAFGNIQQRYSPFLGAERGAVGQLGAELGLTTGDQYTGYRDSPAYMASQDASRVAEEEAMATITQDAANAGTLYSGTRGAALVDRAKRGSYERAGIEQSYYQNYMNMLQNMANPQAAGAVSQFEAGTARDVGQNYIGASGAALGAEGTALSATTGAQLSAEQLRQLSAYTGLNGLELRDMLRSGTEGANYILSTLPTGSEGDYLRDMLRTGTEGMEVDLGTMATGTEGSQFALPGLDTGTAGTPYRMAAETIPLETQATAGGMITGNMPGGFPGASLRLEGTGAQSQSVADAVGGATNIYTSYMMGPQNPKTTMGPPSPPGY